MLVLSAAMPFMFGRMVGDERQGRALLITMFLFLIVGTGIVYWAEASGNPILAALGVDPTWAIWKARKSASGSPCRRSSRW